MKRFLVALVAAVAMTSAAHAAPLNQSQNMTISANIVASCTFAAANLPVGSYDPLSAIDTQVSRVDALTYQCTPGDYNIELSTFGGTLENGANAITYTLSVGGSSMVQTDKKPITADGTLQTIPVTATIAKNQFKPAGLYTETVMFTLML
jgi:spore coat protein U-like protein